MNTKGDKNRSVRFTKRRLEKTMMVLLKEKPIEHITVRELTEQADMNRATFYLHYKDVYDLLDQMETKAVTEMQAFLTKEALNNFSNDGYPLLDRIFTHLVEHKDRYVILFGPNGRKEAKRMAVDKSISYIMHIMEEEFHIPYTLEQELGTRFIIEGGLSILEKYLFDETPLDEDVLKNFSASVTNNIVKYYQANLQAF